MRGGGGNGHLKYTGHELRDLPLYCILYQIHSNMHTYMYYIQRMIYLSRAVYRKVYKKIV